MRTIKHALDNYILIICLLARVNFSYAAVSPPVWLTPQEQDWLKTHPTVRYCFSPLWKPYDYFEQGEHRGIFKDYLDLFAQKLGVTLIPVPTVVAEAMGKGWQKALDFARERRCDFISGAVPLPERESYLNFTAPYFNVTQVLIAKPDKPFVSGIETIQDQTIGIPQAAIAQLIRDDFPALKYLQLDTYDAANALDNNRIYAYVTPLEHALGWMNERLYNYKIIAKLHYPYPISVAVRKDWPELLGIMDKVVASLTQADHNTIERKWTTYTIKDDVDYSRLWQLAGIAIIIIGIILYWNRRLATEIVQRQQIEQQLRKLSRAVDQSHNTIVITDADANIEFANPAFTKTTGYTTAEVLGQNPHILHSGEHSPEFYLDMWNTLTAGKVWQGELHNKRKDGSLYWENATISPVKDSKDNITHYVAVKENITQHKLNEILIREHIARLDEAQRIAKIGSWHISLPDDTLTWSAQTYRMFGIPPGTPVNMADLIACIHPDDRTLIIDGWQAALLGKPYEIEHRIVVQGQTYWVIERAEIQFDTIGTPISGIGTVQDITILKQAEKLQALNEARLDALLQLSRIAPSMNEEELLRAGLEYAERLTDSTIGYLHFINEDQTTVQLGFWSQATMAQCHAVTSSHYPIMQAGIWADAIRQRRALIHNDYQNMGEQCRGYPQGHTHLLNHMNAPVVENDQVKILIGVGNKATPYDEADLRQLQLIAEDLWRIVVRRRIELVLEKAREAAEAASRAKTAFLTHISHELRTPLNGILGFAQLLLTDALLSKDARNYIIQIRRSGDHLLNLINDILDVARVESGKLELRPTQVQLPSLLLDVVAMITERADTKGLRLQLEWHSLPTDILIDAMRLKQIILNLLGNAIKFTRQGDIKFWVSVRLLKRKNWVRLKFAVLDTGPGIAASHLQQIMQPFERLPDNSVEGAGLGLSITNVLVKRMGGRFQIGSQTAPGLWAATTKKQPPVPLPINHGTLVWFSLAVPLAIPSDIRTYTAVTTREQPQLTAIPIPENAWLQQIYECAQAGDMIQLQGLCESLAINYPAFATKVREYIDNFQLNELSIFLDNSTKCC